MAAPVREDVLLDVLIQPLLHLVDKLKSVLCRLGLILERLALEHVLQHRARVLLTHACHFDLI